MSIQVCVLTPNCIFQDETVDELILPTSTGQVGILNYHAPLITALDIGPMIFLKQSKWISLALIGGFALVQENQVIVLVNEAAARSTIEIGEVEKEIERSKNRLDQATEKEEKVEANFAFKRARARYQVVCDKNNA